MMCSCKHLCLFLFNLNVLIFTLWKADSLYNCVFAQLTDIPQVIDIMNMRLAMAHMRIHETGKDGE